MKISSYETHNFPNPRLPFILHPQFHLIGEDVETNWHKNIEVLCCLDGEGYVRCGTEIFDFTKNDIIVVNSDVIHTIGSCSSLKYSCLIIGYSFCSDNGFDTDTLQFHNVIKDPELVDLVQSVVITHNKYDSNTLCAIADYRYAVLNVLRKLCRDHCSQKPVNLTEVSSEHIKKAITYIRTNVTKKLTLDDIAENIGISKYYLSREFKSITGTTIVSFINTIRCSEAKRLIEKGMLVSQAAYSCGFDNLSYFSRTFQKIIGSSPSSFSPK